MTQRERIGFIGLGLMGKPMVRRLLGAGFQVTVFNRSRPAMAELGAEGARVAESAADVAAAGDVVITMLPDGPDVEQVLGGPDGVLANAGPGVLVIDMSTIAPATARALHDRAAKRGVRMLDAPVSGGDAGAKAGTLSIMVGGAVEDFDLARPLFEAMGRTITHCGPAGTGQIVKACNQIVVAVVMDAVAEALLLAEKAGVAAAVVQQVLQGGLAQTRVMEMKGPKMAARDYAPGFRAALHLKDLRIVAGEAAGHGLELPGAALVQTMLARLVEEGRGELDHSALFEVVAGAGLAARNGEQGTGNRSGNRESPVT